MFGNEGKKPKEATMERRQKRQRAAGFISMMEGKSELVRLTQATFLGQEEEKNPPRQ